jgi:hypothetical protein
MGTTEGTWTSGALPLGDSTANITLTAASGVTSQTTIKLGRSGSQVAFGKATNAAASNRLGASIASYNNIIVAGAPYESTGGTDSGAAYVFIREGSSLRQLAMLKAQPPVAAEYFGSSVAILGDTIAVGAPATDPTEQPTSTSGTGGVYLFARAGDDWKPVGGKITPEGAQPGDMFGFQVLLATKELLVTAPYQSEVARGSGAAYVFQRDNLASVVKLKSSKPSVLAAWGTGLAYDEGKTIAVGAGFDSSNASTAGSASVFTLQAGQWTHEQLLTASTPTASATFGWSLAVLGDTLVVGAPRWGHWVETPAGETHIFRRMPAGWTETQILKAPLPRAQDYFGSCMILTPEWLLLGSNGNGSGTAGIPGDPNDTSSWASGGIYLYDRSKGELSKPMLIKAAMPQSLDSFGVAISLSSDFSLAVGASYNDGPLDSGAVHVIQ